ncbi:hypothetical protein JCM1840_003435 [Sporobolomyces johnsonii]
MASVPALPEVGAAFSDLRELRRAVLRAVWPATGCNVTSYRDSQSTVSLYCQPDTETPRESACPFRIVAMNGYLPRKPGVLAQVVCEWQMKQVWAQWAGEEAKPLDVDKLDAVGPQTASRSSTRSSSLSPPLPSPEHFTNKRRQRAPSPPLHVSEEERKPKRIKEPVVLILDDDDDDEGHDDDSDESLEAFLGRLSSVFNLAQHAQAFRGKELAIETPQQLLDTAADNLDELIRSLKEMLGLGPASALRRGLEEELVRRGEL